MSLKAGTSLAAIALALLVGYQVGKSKGQEQREALQREILRIQAVALQRNVEVQRLRAYIAGVDADLLAIGLQREQFEQFLEWLTEQHPTIVARYRAVQQAEARVATIEQDSWNEKQLAQQRYNELCRQFPEEAAKLSASARDFLS